MVNTAEYFTGEEFEQDNSEGKVLSFELAITRIREAREKGLQVVLAQGVFDVVHIGHIEYLRAAKQAGDLLFVGIENDESVRLNKGEKRPFNSLEERLELLAELQSVDFVFGYTDVPSYGNSDMFTQRYIDLNPTAVAVSSWDSNIELKGIQAEQAGVGIVVADHPKRNSSTRLLQLIGHE